MSGAIPDLDRIDLALLAVLQREGRIANSELAERVNLSASACLRRVQRLERAGVIAGYGARLAPAALGLGLTAFVRVQRRSTAPVPPTPSPTPCAPGTRWSPAMP